MDSKTARAILVGLVGEADADADGLAGVRAETLRYGVGEAVVIANEVGKPITLDGNFTADQLEAIVMWMRDPVGVASGAAAAVDAEPLKQVVDSFLRALDGYADEHNTRTVPFNADGALIRAMRRAADAEPDRAHGIS